MAPSILSCPDRSRGATGRLNHQHNITNKFDDRSRDRGPPQAATPVRACRVVPGAMIPGAKVPVKGRSEKDQRPHPAKTGASLLRAPHFTSLWVERRVGL